MVLLRQKIEELPGLHLSHSLCDEDFEHFLDVLEVEGYGSRVDDYELYKVYEGSDVFFVGSSVLEDVVRELDWILVQKLRVLLYSVLYMGHVSCGLRDNDLVKIELFEYLACERLDCYLLRLLTPPSVS